MPATTALASQVKFTALIDTLENHQEKCRKRLLIVPRLTGDELLKKTLEQQKRREGLSKKAGEFIFTGSFQYPAQLEELRWQRTREVIMRIRPGVDEDPVYLAELAREAASIEIVVSKCHTPPSNPELLALCDRVLLGTTTEVTADASSGLIGNRSLVLLRMGLLEFLYQAAKAVILSWEPVSGRAGLHTGPEAVARTLSKNPYPIELLSKSLDSYMFEGRPHAAGYSPPPKEYEHALENLTTFNERFVIAHEYGHSLWQDLKIPNSPPIPQSARHKELQADFFALLFCTMSGEVLDLASPNAVLQGGFFSLTVLDILRKTRELTYFGAVQEDHGNETHPPIGDRINWLKKEYQKYFFADDNKYDLSVERALDPSTTLENLWRRIQDRFVAAKQAGRKLHPVWRAMMPRY